MEHNVYLCTWQRSPAGYILWVKSRPELRGSGPTYAGAEDALIDAIQRAGGAMQAVLEFDPPLPKSALDEKYGTPELYLIGGDDRFESDAPARRPFESAAEADVRLQWKDAFYSKPVCRKCGYATHPRSEKPLVLRYAPAGFDGAFGSAGNDAGPVHQIVSDEFLSLLTPDEQRTLEFRPVVRKGRRRFHELIGPEGPPFVAVAGLNLSGWRCTQCDRRVLGYWIEGLTIHSFIARPDLPDPPSGIFTVGTFPEIHLAATLLRWQQLVGKKGTRGFVSRPLGVAPPHEVIRTPDLSTCEERLLETRHGHSIQSTD